MTDLKEFASEKPATAIADILHEYRKNATATAIEALSDAIRNITKVLHNRLNTI